MMTKTRASNALLPIATVALTALVSFAVYTLTQGRLQKTNEEGRPLPKAGEVSTGNSYLQPALREVAEQLRQSPELRTRPPQIATLLADLENLLTASPQKKAFTHEEVDRIKIAFVSALEVKVAFEKRLIHIVKADMSEIEFEIPPYSMAGAELKRIFETEAAGNSGEFPEIDVSTAAFIDHQFAHFGGVTQRIRVVPVVTPGRGQTYFITHAYYATDRLHMQTGGQSGGFVASTSTATLDITQMADGAYANIASAVARNFGLPLPKS